MLNTQKLTGLVIKGLAFAFTFAALWPAGHAQTFPEKMVRVVVPYPAGGGSDATARALSQKLVTIWNHPVVVDNRAGASGVIGTGLVAKSVPDGHTLLLDVPSHVVNPVLMKSLPYDTLRDLVPVTSVMRMPLVLVVSSKAPWNSLQQLVADARKTPGKISIGSSEGSSMLTGELFKQRAGIDLVPVPYKGSGPMMSDLLGGHVGMGFIPITSALAHLKNGAIRVLAVASSKRNHALADTPTFAESGVALESYSWTGIFAPGGTPADILNKIHADLSTALADTALRDKITQGAAEISLEKPEVFKKAIAQELEQWKAVAARAGVVPE